MPDRVASLLFYSLGTLLLGAMTAGIWWIMIKVVGAQGRVAERQAQIFAREAETLRLFAAKVGGRYEPGTALDAGGDAGLAPGWVVCTCHDLVTRVTYAESAWTLGDTSDDPKYVPRVLVDVPPGRKWKVTVDASDGSRVRERIAAGRAVDDAFAVRGGEVPAAAQASLRYVGARVFSMHVSPSRMDARMWPDDMTKYAAPLSAIWDGGYDVAALEQFVEQTCFAAAALLVSGPDL